MCITIPFMYLPVLAPDGPAMAVAGGSSAFVPELTPLGPASDAGGRLGSVADGPGVCRRISSRTVALTESRKAVITSNPAEAPLGLVATASAVPVVEEPVAVIPVAAWSSLGIGSILIANLTETILDTILTLASWKTIFALGKERQASH